MDAVNSTQLAVKNIIIENCNSSIMDAGNGTLDVDYMSGGTGKYITNGKAIDITWKKASETAPTKYYDSNGNEIMLNQGKTWVCIMPNDRAADTVVYGTSAEFESR